MLFLVTANACCFWSQQKQHAVSKLIHLYMKENQYDKNYKFEKIDRELVSGGPKIGKLDSMSFQTIVVVLA